MTSWKPEGQIGCDDCEPNLRELSDLRRTERRWVDLAQSPGETRNLAGTRFAWPRGRDSLPVPPFGSPSWGSVGVPAAIGVQRQAIGPRNCLVDVGASNLEVG